jgi:uncharacterized repeat protein (TIGR03847 family)
MLPQIFLERSFSLPSNHDFQDVEALTLATVGEPGQRVFLLQATNAKERVTIKLEKIQVATLVQYLSQLIVDLPRPGELPELPELILSGPMDWVAGPISLAYDEVRDRVDLVIEEAVGDDEIASRALLGLSREQAAAIAIVGTQLVQGGRPPCPLCGYPLDPSGHLCPRTNGHHAPTL